MTASTQAQIEAAIKAVSNIPAINTGYISLRAQETLSDQLTRQVIRTIVEVALTAAAEAGEPITELITQHAINVEAATIERCAQVAERFQTYSALPILTIAAAIRAMKEKP